MMGTPASVRVFAHSSPLLALSPSLIADSPRSLIRRCASSWGAVDAPACGCSRRPLPLHSFALFGFLSRPCRPVFFFLLFVHACGFFCCVSSESEQFLVVASPTLSLRADRTQPRRACGR